MIVFCKRNIHTWSIGVLLAILNVTTLSHSFVPPLPSLATRQPDVLHSNSIRWDTSSPSPLSLTICHAKKGGKKKKTRPGSSNNKTKKPKKSSNNNKSPHEQDVTRASQEASVVLPGVKTRAPPWQVLSTKDAKKNVVKEKIRRQRAREGIHTPMAPEMTNEQSKSKALLSDANRSLLKWKRFNPSTAPCGMSFIGSYLEKRLPPRLGVPEVAFLGRSNVGKSSLLNRLSSMTSKSDKYATDQARVGKTPGATASVNLYCMLTKATGDMTKPILGWADLPGFGYAKLSKETKEAVQLAAERYLGKREELALGILLVDARRQPSDDDRAVLAALYDLGVPLVVVATKVDKLANTQVEPSLQVIRHGLGLPEGQPLCVSSVTGEGTKELWKIILEACEARVEELRDKLERAGAKDDEKEEEEYETVPLDVEGNPLLFEDSDDIVYDQGFDWVHDSAVMYDGDDEDYSDKDEIMKEDDAWDDEPVDDYDGFESDKEAFKLKNLKRRVRDMERRGEL